MKKNIKLPSEYRLNERLRYIREQRKLSQADFAKTVGLSQSTIAQIETGKKEPSLEALRKIAKRLDVDVATLFASEHVHVFDLPRMRRKYKKPGDLSDHLHRALWNVIEYARNIGFLKG